MAIHKNIATCFSDKELADFIALGGANNMTEPQLLKEFLRLYQVADRMQKQGLRLAFVDDADQIVSTIALRSFGKDAERKPLINSSVLN